MTHTTSTRWRSGEDLGVRRILLLELDLGHLQLLAHGLELLLDVLRARPVLLRRVGEKVHPAECRETDLRQVRLDRLGQSIVHRSLKEGRRPPT